MTQRTLGPFIIEEQIGAGGMGVVYLATYTKTGEKVALKVLAPDVASDEQITARFLQEIDILKKLKHDNIVRYFGGGTSNKQPYYAMEQVKGGSLEDRLLQKKKLSWEETIEIGLQVCDALQYAHNNGVIHRDLKPANLLLNRKKKIKLTDFGIARDTRRNTALTAAGKTVGTFDYMAPEQISGKYPVSHKTDLYALGCVLFELLTGETPFHCENAPETLFKHLDAKPPRIREKVMECPVWLEKLISKLLAKEPDDRPYDALAVQTALKDVVKKVTERATVTNLKSRKQTQAGGGRTLSASKRKRKKKNKQTSDPFWEKSWFLGTILLLIIALVGYSLMPLSEEQLFTKADELMKSPTDQRASRIIARDKYLIPLLNRFPKGEYATKAENHLEDISMFEAEREIEIRIKYGRDPKTEAERLYREAFQFEKFGDQIAAKTKYLALVNLMKGNVEDKPVVNLARRQIHSLDQSQGGNQQEDRIELLNQILESADTLHRAGKVAKARQKWESILALYGSNKEFQPQVDQAAARLKGDFSKTIPTTPSPEKKSSPPNP